jgi:16S rRNA processing protein RimM
VTVACCSRSLSELVQVGRVGRAHGLDGSFVVEQASSNEALFAVGAPLIAGGEPATVAARKRSGGRLVVKLDRDVSRGTELAVPRAALPEPEADSYYVFQLIGLEVVDEGGHRLGSIQDVAPGVANDVLTLDSGLALPMHEQCVRKIDVEGGRVVVASGFGDG